MATLVPVKSRSPLRPGNYMENGIAKQSLKDYIQTLVLQLLVFFSIQNVGLRPLRSFCAEALQFPINIQEIEQVILHAGRKAAQKLAPLDLKAGELARTIEVDATWKSRFHKFLAAIAREGNYLFCLEHVKNESAAAVRPALQRVARLCCNLRLVVTDMALGFAEAIPRIFQGIVHLFCHNHVLKAVDREMPELRKDFSGARKKLYESKGPARTANKWLRRNRFHMYNARSYRKKLQGQKFHLCQERGIPVKPNGALMYGVDRNELDYILDTFFVLREKELRRYGEYRTKRLVMRAFGKFLRDPELGLIFQLQRVNIERLTLETPEKKIPANNDV